MRAFPTPQKFPLPTILADGLQVPFFWTPFGLEMFPFVFRLVAAFRVDWLVVFPVPIAGFSESAPRRPTTPPNCKTFFLRGSPSFVLWNLIVRPLTSPLLSPPLEKQFFSNSPPESDIKSSWRCPCLAFLKMMAASGLPMVSLVVPFPPFYRLSFFLI